MVINMVRLVYGNTFWLVYDILRLFNVSYLRSEYEYWFFLA